MLAGIEAGVTGSETGDVGVGSRERRHAAQVAPTNAAARVQHRSRDGSNGPATVEQWRDAEPVAAGDVRRGDVLAAHDVRRGAGGRQPGAVVERPVRQVLAVEIRPVLRGVAGGVRRRILHAGEHLAVIGSDVIMHVREIQRRIRLAAGYRVRLLRVGPVSARVVERQRVAGVRAAYGAQERRSGSLHLQLPDLGPHRPGRRRTVRGASTGAHCQRVPGYRADAHFLERRVVVGRERDPCWQIGEVQRGCIGDHNAGVRCVDGRSERCTAASGVGVSPPTVGHRSRERRLPGGRIEPLCRVGRRPQRRRLQRPLVHVTPRSASKRHHRAEDFVHVRIGVHHHVVVIGGHGPDRQGRGCVVGPIGNAQRECVLAEHQPAHDRRGARLSVRRVP